MEFEISHQVAGAIRNVAMVRRLIKTNCNQRVAASAESTATQASFHAAISSLELFSDTQRRDVESKRAYNKARADYMKAVAQVEARKGSSLSRYRLELVEAE